MPISTFARRKDIPNPNSLNGVIRLQGTFPNDSYILDTPKLIHTNEISVGNVGLGLDPLQSFTLPAKAWKDRDILKVHYAGEFGANSDSKRIVVEFGGVTIHDPGLFAHSGLRFTYDLDYIRLSSVGIRISGLVSWGSINRDASGTMTGSGLAFAIHNTSGVFPDMDVNDSVMRLLGESSTATDNNILHRKTVIYLTRRS